MATRPSSHSESRECRAAYPRQVGRGGALIGVSTMELFEGSVPVRMSGVGSLASLPSASLLRASARTPSGCVSQITLPAAAHLAAASHARTVLSSTSSSLASSVIDSPLLFASAGFGDRDCRQSAVNRDSRIECGGISRRSGDLRLVSQSARVRVSPLLATQPPFKRDCKPP